MSHKFLRGVITYGKTYLDSKGRVHWQKDKSKIIRTVGKHEPVMSNETGRKLDRLLKPIPRKEEGVAFDPRKGRKKAVVKKCQQKKADGITPCDKKAKGINEVSLLPYIKKDMQRFQDELFADVDMIDMTSEIGDNPAEVKQREIEKLVEKMEKVKDLFIDGIINRDEVKERKRRN